MQGSVVGTLTGGMIWVAWGGEEGRRGLISLAKWNVYNNAGAAMGGPWSGGGGGGGA